jgi:predicted component of type VI protein secretion system
MDPGLIKQINQRIQEELLKKEIEVVQYGLTELEHLIEKRHQDIASLQVDIKGLAQKFQNRLKILKTSKIF